MKVLFISDDQKDRQSLKVLLQDSCLLECCSADQNAFCRINEHNPDVVVLDIGDGADRTAIEMLASIHYGPSHPGVIAVGSVSDPEVVTAAIKHGADDYLMKPLRARVLQSKLAVVAQNRPPDLVSVVAEAPDETPQLIGESTPMRGLQARLRKLARVDSPVLLLGESGTGKEVAARTIHRYSRRNGGPFITVNCGAIPEGLFESEMFGVDRGAFTGALTRPGYFEAADGGTLFLDEIGELPGGAQAKLLRVLEDQTVVHMGSTRQRRVDTRLIAATNRDLKRELDAGRFRMDLYFRLCVLNCEIPPLRERPEDIPLLAAVFLVRLMDRVPFEGRARELSGPALKKLAEHRWPGNVRELRNVIERAAVVSERRIIGPDDIEFL